MLKAVIDTNIWVRALLGGRTAIPVLEAWRQGRFQVIVSEQLLEELAQVCRRPRFQQRINARDVTILLDQLRWRGVKVAATTTAPDCRDIEDQPVLATAIEGGADIIVSADADLRTDERLCKEMAERGVSICGVDALLARCAIP